MLRVFRLVFIISAILALSAATAFAEGQNTAAPTNAQRQAMFQKAFQELKQANDTLDTVYQEILDKHQEDKVFMAKFTNAQAAWQAFRDAELEAIFPSPDKKVYGSLYPVAYAQAKTNLILDRAKQLNQWITGFPEGTIKAGSRGITNPDK
jgi:uncharacterized protein YecT (DUF1311 family)